MLLPISFEILLLIPILVKILSIPATVKVGGISLGVLFLSTIKNVPPSTSSSYEIDKSFIPPKEYLLQKEMQLIY
jgi:hypothetical protein